MNEASSSGAIARVVAAATISNFGSMLTRVALPFVAIDALGAGAADMSALGIARLVPGLLLGFWLSAWIERRRKRGVMIGADLVHAALLLAVPFAYALGLLSMPLLWGFAAASGLLSYAFGVARLAFVPSLASRDQLVAANARIAAGSSAAEALAFGGGGWLVQLLSAPFALIADAFTYLGSALLLRGIREGESAPAFASRERGLRRALAGVRAIHADAVLGALAAVSIAVVVASEALGVVYFLFVRAELGFDPGVLGMLFAAGSVAALASSLAAEALGRRFGARGAMGAGLIGGGLATGVLALAPGPGWLGAACIFTQQLGDAGLAVFEIHALSARQQASGAEVQSRVHGAFSFLAGWAALAGAALGGVLGSVFGPRASVAIAAAALVTFGVAWLAVAPRAEPRSATP